MLEPRHLQKVGPAPEMRVELEPRLNLIRCYRLGQGASGFDLAHLELRAPFITSELRRQGQLVRGVV